MSEWQLLALFDSPNHLNVLVHELSPDQQESGEFFHDNESNALQHVVEENEQFTA